MRRQRVSHQMRGGFIGALLGLVASVALPFVIDALTPKPEEELRNGSIVDLSDSQRTKYEGDFIQMEAKAQQQAQDEAMADALTNNRLRQKGEAYEIAKAQQESLLNIQRQKQMAIDDGLSNAQKVARDKAIQLQIAQNKKIADAEAASRDSIAKSQLQNRLSATDKRNSINDAQTKLMKTIQSRFEASQKARVATSTPVNRIISLKQAHI